MKHTKQKHKRKYTKKHRHRRHYKTRKSFFFERIAKKYKTKNIGEWF